jgi:hypothetical protein
VMVLFVVVVFLPCPIVRRRSVRQVGGGVPFRIVAADGVDVWRASGFATARSHRAGLRFGPVASSFLSSSFFPPNVRVEPRRARCLEL